MLNFFSRNDLVCTPVSYTKPIIFDLCSLLRELQGEGACNCLTRITTMITPFNRWDCTSCTRPVSQIYWGIGEGTSFIIIAVHCHGDRSCFKTTISLFENHKYQHNAKVSTMHSNCTVCITFTRMAPNFSTLNISRSIQKCTFLEVLIFLLFFHMQPFTSVENIDNWMSHFG